MSSPQPTQPPPPLRCEQCRYDLTGLKITDNCPECGTPVEASLPNDILGTPYQQRPCWRSWIKTAWLGWRHHDQFMHSISPRAARLFRADSRSLLALILTFIGPSTAVWIVMLIIAWRENNHARNRLHFSETLTFGSIMLPVYTAIIIIAFYTIRLLSISIALIVSRTAGLDAPRRTFARAASQQCAIPATAMLIVAVLTAVIGRCLGLPFELAGHNQISMINFGFWLFLSVLIAIASFASALVGPAICLRHRRGWNLPGAEVRLTTQDE